MFKEMHLKFLLIPLILVGALLAITFSTIFSITYSSTTTDMERALENGSLSTDNGRFYYVKVFGNGEVEYSSNLNNMTAEEKNAFRAFLTADEGKFTYNDVSYAYIKKNQTLDDDRQVTVYTILDWTERRNTLVTLGSTLIIVFFVSLLVLGGLSYILAYSATEPVKEAFNKEKELLANASHELKTPITVAKTNLDLVLSDPSQTVAENMRWLEGAKYQIDRMNSLILQMLELSRLERNDYYAEKTDLNISTLIEGI